MKGPAQANGISYHFCTKDQNGKSFQRQNLALRRHTSHEDPISSFKTQIEWLSIDQMLTCVLILHQMRMAWTFASLLSDAQSALSSPKHRFLNDVDCHHGYPHESFEHL